MNLIEVYGDIFSSQFDGYKKAHCISSDLAMGAGIAKQFDRQYHIKEILSKYIDLDEGLDYPHCFRVGNIYNIITKEKYYHKPSYDDFTKACELWKDLMIKDRVETVVVPELGCGLDKLKWNKVRDILTSIFANTSIIIIVVHYCPETSV